MRARQERDQGSTDDSARAEIDVAAPAKEVFRHFVDRDLSLRWVPNLVEIRRDGELAVGTRSTSVFRVSRFRTMLRHGVILEMEPPRLLVTEITGPGSTAVVQRVEILETGPATARVRIEVRRVRVSSWARLVLGDGPREWERGLELSLERLKTAAEAPDTRPPDLPYMPAPSRVFAALVLLSVVVWILLLLAD